VDIHKYFDILILLKAEGAEGMLDLSSIRRRSNQLVLNAIEGIQFGKIVVTIQCTANDILKFIDVDRTVQRELDSDKVTGIGRYIEYGLNGHSIYFSPLLLSARGKGNYVPDARQFCLATGERLFVLDGQHRIRAFEQIKNRLESLLERAYSKELEDKYNSLCNFPITLQVYKDLDKTEERQLFTDVNLKASVVHNTMLIMYGDVGKDLYAKMVHEIIAQDTNEIFEVRARSTKTKLMTASTLYQLCRLLNEGHLHITLTSTLTTSNFDKYKERVLSFVDSFVSIAGKNYLDRDRYVIAMPNVILALGKYVHDAMKDSSKWSMPSLMKRVQGFDWTHRNREFRKLGIDYNHNTQKYKFNAIGRVVPNLADIFLGDLKRKEAH